MIRIAFHKDYISVQALDKRTLSHTKCNKMFISSIVEWGTSALALLFPEHLGTGSQIHTNRILPYPTSSPEQPILLLTSRKMATKINDLDMLQRFTEALHIIRFPADILDNIDKILSDAAARGYHEATEKTYKDLCRLIGNAAISRREFLTIFQIRFDNTLAEGERTLPITVINNDTKLYQSWLEFTIKDEIPSVTYTDY